MIHYKEAYISTKQHVWEITGAVIIDDIGYFVGKCSKQNMLAMDLSSILLIMLSSGLSGMLSCSSGWSRLGIVASCALAGVASHVQRVWSGLGVILRIPLCGQFRWPFTISRLATRYLRTVCASRWRSPLRKPALMALSNEVMEGLQKLWWANFTLLILVVPHMRSLLYLRWGCIRSISNWGQIVAGSF